MGWADFFGTKKKHWYQACEKWDGCLVKTSTFSCKDLVHHATETTMYKWMFQVPGIYYLHIFL